MLKKIFQRKIPEQLPDLTGLLEKQYHDQVARQHIQFDNAQFLALQHLQILLDHLLIAANYGQKSVAFKLFSLPPVKCQSLYLYGDVGCGKSMLMTLFYETCLIEQKKRVHFTLFMLEVHAFIHEWRQLNNTDAVSALAKKIRSSALLLCVDEFHVTDIADAMILKRLFSQLFKLGALVVITSNRHPDDLYQGGLQREQFLGFTKLLQEESKIIELVTKEDYRLVHLCSLKTTYYFPLDTQSGNFVQRIYNELTHCSALKTGILSLLGRQLMLSSVHEDIAFGTFDELCVQPLGSADYKLIAHQFSTLIVSEIPKLSAERHNQAKRFMTLIDALYEYKVKLICTAEVSPQELYTEGEGVFEFRRTVSRLIEMQSEAYLQSEHIKDL